MTFSAPRRTNEQVAHYFTWYMGMRPHHVQSMAFINLFHGFSSSYSADLAILPATAKISGHDTTWRNDMSSKSRFPRVVFPLLDRFQLHEYSFFGGQCTDTSR